jgi:3',5'-cyclic AMP phosphodiesterase CpdA
MLRLAHFSDVHLTSRPLGWRGRDLLSKKVPGWVNVRLLGRGARFKHSTRIVKLLREEFASRGFDHLIFSGDATKLAFDREFSIAANLLGVLDTTQVPCIAVPGNHDLYTRDAAKRKLFDHHFGPWLAGQRIDEHTFPYARKVGPAWLIAVNSCTANWWTFDASGSIGPEQLTRLRQLCETLDGGPRILVTHYPLRTSRRKLERRSHRLRDHAAALNTAKECGIGLWLHGHIHKPYILDAGADLPFPTICAGSCTQTHRWCYNEYDLDGDVLRIVQRKYNLASHCFEDGMRSELRLMSV